MGLPGLRRDGDVTPSLVTRYPQLGITRRDWVLVAAVGNATSDPDPAWGQPWLGQAGVSRRVAGVRAFAALSPDFRGCDGASRTRSGMSPGPAGAGAMM